MRWYSIFLQRRVRRFEPVTTPDATDPFLLFPIGCALVVFIVVRLPSLRLALVRARAMPYLIYCWALAALYIIAFSSFANFGLLVRQRSLLFPALFALLCVSPALDRAARARRSGSAPDLVRA